MPTASKLVGGLMLALTASIAAWIFITQTDNLIPLGLRFIAGNAVVGFFAGWYALGKNPGHGVFAAAGNGLRALVFLLIGSGLLFSGVFVLGNLERNNFKDPMDLPLLWVETAFEYVVAAFTQEVLIALIVGGLVSGIVTYISSRRWT